MAIVTYFEFTEESASALFDAVPDLEICPQCECLFIVSAELGSSKRRLVGPDDWEVDYYCASCTDYDLQTNIH
jgi:hypothetical protein